MTELLRSISPGQAFVAILVLVALYVFGREKWRKERSASNRTEAQDSEQASLMRDLREEKKAANERADLAYAQLIAAREDSAKVREILIKEIAEMKARGDRRDHRLERQRKQLGLLAMIVAKARPELAPVIEQSGFVDFDDSGGNLKKGKP